MHDDADIAYAERSILCTIIYDGHKAMDACVRLRKEHFSLASHREIYEACQSLLATKRTIDLTALRGALGSRVDAVGGFTYLLDLADALHRSFDIVQRVDAVMEAWKLRRTREICLGAAADCLSGASSAETLANLQANVLDVISESAEQDEPHVEAYSNAAFDDLMERSAMIDGNGLTYGVRALDNWTGGMQPGQVTVVGARSGVGKSSLMKQSAAANAKKGIAVTLFSLEMSRAEILEGFWAIESGVEFRKITRPQLLNLAERNALREAMELVKLWPLRIYDKAELSLNQIVSLARLNVRQYGAKLICVDYCQSVEAEGDSERTKVATVSSKLTKMAKTEKCSLMLLSQLRKVSTEQYSHPPTAADLRETDQMNNDAHVVVLIHRSWDAEACCISDETSFIIPKARRGKTGALRAVLNPATLCFEDPLRRIA